MANLCGTSGDKRRSVQAVRRAGKQKYRFAIQERFSFVRLF
jgi:hypothetical protein